MGVLQINPSSFCPARCIYCPRSLLKDWAERHVDRAAFDAALDLASALSAPHVHLQGWGSPCWTPPQSRWPRRRGGSSRRPSR